MSAAADEPEWLLRLHMLLLRYPQYGAAADLAGMTKPETYGLFCFLSRLAET